MRRKRGEEEEVEEGKKGKGDSMVVNDTKDIEIGKRTMKKTKKRKRKKRTMKRKGDLVVINEFAEDAETKGHWNKRKTKSES